jgi:hypothetical protein
VVVEAEGIALHLKQTLALEEVVGHLPWGTWLAQLLLLLLMTFLRP